MGSTPLVALTGRLLYKEFHRIKQDVGNWY